MSAFPVLWCAVCEEARVPLIEDGTCGWCGKAKWFGRRPTMPPWPAPDLSEGINAPSPDLRPDGDEVRAVMRGVAKAYGLTAEDLQRRDRTPRVARARQLAMAEARWVTGASYPVIAREFRRTHATIIHAVRRMELQRREGVSA